MNPGDRGIILSNRININNDSISMNGSHISPDDLRFALLFFDKIAWPVNRYLHFGTDENAKFLIDQGIMVRPDPTPPGPVSFGGAGSVHIVKKMFLESIRMLEGENPGKWSYGFHGRFNDLNLDLSRSKSIAVDLISSIPLPNKEVPLQDVIEFKVKRQDELLRFRMAIDKMYDDIIMHPDIELKLNSCISELRVAVSELSKVSNEAWGSAINLNMKVKFEVGLNNVWSGLLGYFFGDAIGSPEIGALLGAIANSVRFESEPSIGVVSPRSNPYCYINRIQAGI